MLYIKFGMFLNWNTLFWIQIWISDKDNYCLKTFAIAKMDIDKSNFTRINFISLRCSLYITDLVQPSNCPEFWNAF